VFSVQLSHYLDFSLFARISFLFATMTTKMDLYLEVVATMIVDERLVPRDLTSVRVIEILRSGGVAPVDEENFRARFCRMWKNFFYKFSVEQPMLDMVQPSELVPWFHEEAPPAIHEEVEVEDEDEE